MKTLCKYELVLVILLSAYSLKASSPNIAFTPVPCAKTAPVSLEADITDVDGIEVSPGLKPRLYYKKKSEHNVLAATNDNLSNGWKYVEASNAVSPFSFDFDFSKLTSATTKNDTIQYFVVAQDLNGEVGWNSVSFDVNPTSVDLTSSAFPATGTINLFRTIRTFSGNFTVDSTGIANDTNFLSITKAGGLFDAINEGVLSGNISVVVKHSLYAENGVHALNQWEEYNGCAVKTTPSYRLKITPQTNGILIAGNSTNAIIKLNSADRVVIDGRVSPGSSVNGFSFVNNLSASNTAVFHLVSNGSNGCERDTIRYCNIIGGAPQNITAHHTFGIYLNHNNIGEFNKARGKGNNFNSFERNAITRVRYGIALIGNDTVLGSGNAISNNIVGPTSYGIDAIGKIGIAASNQQELTIIGNLVQHVGGDQLNIAGNDDRAGIYLGTIQDNLWNNSFEGDSSTAIFLNSVVKGNKILHIINESGLSSVGIAYLNKHDISATTSIIANNTIAALLSNGNTSDGDHAAGIGIIGGVNDIVAHNSIYLVGDLDPTGTDNTENGASGIRVNSSGSSNPLIAGLNLVNNSVFIDLTNNNNVVSHAISVLNDDFVWGSYGLDNNNFFTGTLNPASVVGGVGAVATFTDYELLGDWQGVYTPTQDISSISQNPLYTSSSDLHIQAASPNIEAGVFVAEVEDDIDGDDRTLRDYPSIGADEFGKYYVWYGRESKHTDNPSNWKSYEAPPFNGDSTLRVIIDTRNNSWSLSDSFVVADLVIKNNCKLNLNNKKFHVYDSILMLGNATVFSGEDTCLSSYAAEEVNGAIHLSGEGYISIRMGSGSICNIIMNADTVSFESHLNIANDFISKKFSAVHLMHSNNVNIKGDLRIFGFLLYDKTETDDKAVFNINGTVQQMVDIRDNGSIPGSVSNLIIDKNATGQNSFANLFSSLNIENYLQLKKGKLISNGGNPIDGDRYRTITLLNGDTHAIRRVNGNVNDAFFLGHINRKLNNEVKSYLFPLGLIDYDGRHGAPMEAYYTPLTVEVLDSTGHSNHITATFYDNDPDTANVGLVGKPYGDHSSAIEDGTGNWVDVKGNYVWRVEYDGGSLPYNIQFSAPFMIANNTDELAATPDELRVMKRSDWDSGNWGFEGAHAVATIHALIPDFAQVNSARRTGLTTFSGFSGGGNSSTGQPLPVKMTELMARPVNNEFIQLGWSTITEINNSGFEIQRSTNGSDFASIGFVAGAGTSTELNHYYFNDKNVAPNVRYYYRLQQINFDGTTELTNVVSAALKEKGNIRWMQLVPNPAEQASSIVVNTTAESVAGISISNIKGDLVQNQTTRLYGGVNNIDLNISNLASGVYIVTLNTESETFSRRLVVK